jgi:hypothetical protein
LGENFRLVSVANARGKEKAWGGVLAQQELAESRVDTSENHRGVGHDGTGMAKWPKQRDGRALQSGQPEFISI